MKYAKILRIVGLTLLGLLVTSALLATPVQLQTAVFKHYKTLPYDAELFHLAYQTFLANEDTTDAFLLSQSAVRQRPNNTQWRMRLGKTALWSGHYDLALQQWTILAKRHPTQEIIDQGSHVAKASHDDAAYIHFQLINLKWHPHSQVILDNLVSAYEREGYPEKSVQLLKTHYQAKKPVFYLTKLAHLYDHLGDKKNEIATLEKLKKIRRKDIQFVLRQAEIYYNDAHLKQALEMLIQSKAYALPNNQDYWRTLGDLAWHLGQLPIALNAYQTLYQHHQADVENTRRLIVLLSNSDPNRAFQIAQQAWQTHRRPVFFMLSLEMGEKIGAWPSLEKLYANISKSQMPALTGSSLYWLVKASTWEHLNNIPQANAVYLKAFELYPNNQSLRIDYLYFLMASNQHRPLIHALQNWPIPKHPNNGLWLAYAQAFLYLKQPSVGLLFYEKHFQTQPALSVQNLIDYADMLETAGYSQLAYQAYATAWQLITVINTHKPTLNAEQLNQYFRLALNYASAETALNAIATHLEHTELSTDQYQALLSIALARENNDEIQDITAAQTLSFEQLQQNPNDTEAYNQFKSAILQTANQLNITTRYLYQGAVRGPEETAQLRLFITPRWRVTPYFKQWNITHFDANQIGTAPALDQTVGTQLFYRTARGDIEANIGYRQAFKHFFTLSVIQNYLLTPRLNSTVTLGLDQPATQSTVLQLSSMQNIAHLVLTYQWLSRNMLIFETEYSALYSQNQHFLGQGQIYSLTLNRHIWQDYPDFTVGIFAAQHAFQRNGTYDDALNIFIPSNSTDTGLAFFIPQTFFQIGAHIHYAITTNDRYMHYWHPYFSAAILHNSISGMGGTFSMGMAGPVIGHDKLNVFAEYARNAEDLNQHNFLFGINYRYYF